MHVWAAKISDLDHEKFLAEMGPISDGAVKRWLAAMDREIAPAWNECRVTDWQMIPPDRSDKTIF